MTNWTGVSTVAYTLLLVLCIFFGYSMGMGGWIAGASCLFAAWFAIAFMGWGDPAVLAAEALVGIFVLWLSLRQMMTHRAWQARIEKDRKESADLQARETAIVSDLKNQMLRKANDVERSLKQYELIRKLAEAVSWEAMAPSLEKALKHFFKVDAWSLYLADQKGELQSVHRRGDAPEARVDDAERRDAYLFTFIGGSGMDKGRSVWALGMPLWRVHERIGLMLLKVPDFAPDQQMSLLTEANAFAIQLIFAMAKARLYRELDIRSRTDGLTGLARRGAFEERLREEVARAQSFRTTFSILMIDIDHFKNLNDTYGHQVGDEVLKTVAQRLREGLYETDVIARYGGEEFIGLLPRSDPAGLRVKADQLRQRVCNQAFVIGLEAITVSVSVGIAHFPQDGKTMQEVMAAADKALYAAKGGGRNRVVEASAVGL